LTLVWTATVFRAGFVGCLITQKRGRRKEDELAVIWRNEGLEILKNELFDRSMTLATVACYTKRRAIACDRV